MKQSEKSESAKEQRTHVRFTKEEYDRIKSDSYAVGQSIPTLLKERYYNGPQMVPLLKKEDLHSMRAELGRIGNNINQIAWRVNSGIREGFEEQITEAKLSFDKLRMFLTGKYCRCNIK